MKKIYLVSIIALIFFTIGCSENTDSNQGENVGTISNETISGGHDKNTVIEAIMGGNTEIYALGREEIPAFNANNISSSEYTRVKPTWAEDGEFTICNNKGEKVMDGLYDSAVIYRDLDIMILKNTNDKWIISDISGEIKFELDNTEIENLKNNRIRDIVPQEYGIYKIMYSESSLLWLDGEGNEITVN